MNARDAALAALWQRLRLTADTQDATGLLSDRALQDAEVLARTVGPGEDLQASVALGLFHWFRCQALPEGQDQADFDACVRLLYPVYQVQPQAVPEQLHSLFDRNLVRRDEGVDAASATRSAMYLFRAFDRGGELPLLLQAVGLFRDVLHVTPEDHPDRGACLSDLGTALRVLFEQTGDVEVLNEVVDVGRRAVQATPADHPGLGGYLSNLGVALRVLFERTGDVWALTEAVDAGRRAVQVTSEDHPDRGACLSNLGTALRVLFERTGDMEVLSEAVGVGRRAVQATPEDLPGHRASLGSLGLALHRLFERTGDVGVLGEAVAVGRRVVQATPEDHPDRAGRLSDLGLALQALFERTGDVGALGEAVDIERRAVRATPEAHPHYHARLDSLSLALRAMFEWTGDVGVLAEAVETGRQAVEATPEDNPDRGGHLNNLGIALRTLSERTGDVGVLGEAVDAGRQAVQICPDDHPDRSARLNNLSGALTALFERTGDAGVLAEAVETGRQAVQAIPEDHADRAACLGNLGLALRALSERTRNVEMLGEAVAVGRWAVEATPEDHPDRGACLSNLGIALRVLFERTGDVEVLAEAVETGRQAVEATPEGHPGRTTYLSNLGLALRALSERTGDVEALAEAVDGYRSASRNTAAEIFVRLEAYRELAILAGEAVSASEALAAVESAVALLPQISPRTLARGDREHRIGRVGALADVAVSAALGAGDPQRAVELLEATRGLLVAESLAARGGEVARLRQAHPDLAREFEDLRDRRDAMEHSPVRPAVPDAPGPIRGVDLGPARRQAQAQWDDLLLRIRVAEGFSGFLAAPGIAELTAQADHGPIVFLSAGPARCDALILTGDPACPVRLVALDRLTRHAAATRAVRLLGARNIVDRDLEPQVGTTGQQEILDTLAWLWDTVAEPVLTALGHTATPARGRDWPRIWWCPVGPMSFLPLHAAGHHRDLDDPDPTVRAAPRTVLDRVISSYAPTVRALAHARSHLQGTIHAGATLVVAVPDAPGATVLAGVDAEADVIQTLIPKALRLDRPVRDEVLPALATHPVAHFACHARPDRNDPAASRLILHDHDTSPLTVADITALRLSGTLAYLSACATSSTSPGLADEAVHLTAAFHLAGYQSVIGTLWPVDDRTATGIAADFYTRITHGGATPPDTAACAHALHHTIRALRADSPDEPTHWAAHIHTGI